ncbi:MAG TPA: riboflavin synthase [Nitrososphaera sp.]|nr:riboflavin synthase [Nitrososphaera sp.]
MFTGIIEGMGMVTCVSKSRSGAETVIRVRLGKLGSGLRKGDSVSINGACLTAAKLSKDQAEFEMISETIRRTNLGQLKPGEMVNVERSLRVGDRLEGHFVLGHVDGTGDIEDIEKVRSETTIWIKLDKELIKSVVPKGSIAVDGISLTLVEVERNRVSISLIPHTLKVTTLGMRHIGDRVNIETDILGKYVLTSLPKT